MNINLILQIFKDYWNKNLQKIEINENINLTIPKYGFN